MEKKEFTLSVFSENQTGMVSRVVAIFTRRHINIESLNTSKSSLPGIHRFTIVVFTTEDNRTYGDCRQQNLGFISSIGHCRLEPCSTEFTWLK